MGILTRWRDGKDFDLTRLRVPRRGSEGAVIVEKLAPMSPFLLAQDGMPTALVRLAGIPEDEVAGLAKAVDDDRCLLVAGWKSYSTYPIFIASLFMYDSPGAPLTSEGYRDITTADVQDFIVGLGHTGGFGQARLYAGDPPELVAQGRFALRLPPFIVPTKFPYQPERIDLETLWLMFKVCAKLRARIPEETLDFKAAVDTHLARTGNISARSDFNNSGVVNPSDPDYPY